MGADRADKHGRAGEEDIRGGKFRAFSGAENQGWGEGHLEFGNPGTDRSDHRHRLRNNVMLS